MATGLRPDPARPCPDEPRRKKRSVQIDPRANTLDNYLRRKGISYACLAVRSGLAYDTCYRIAAGLQKPRQAAFDRLCIALEMQPHELYPLITRAVVARMAAGGETSAEAAAEALGYDPRLLG